MGYQNEYEKRQSDKIAEMKDALKGKEDPEIAAQISRIEKYTQYLIHVDVNWENVIVQCKTGSLNDIKACLRHIADFMQVAYDIDNA
ncbi:MAG: hypothetical protein LBL08_03525 [Candidatus Nomurabacteria bacterium]|jgi:hypothetical protein|nr:hypothetical protein [Candidatus Nomurabacteria bacterium]